MARRTLYHLLFATLGSASNYSDLGGSAPGGDHLNAWEDAWARFAPGTASRQQLESSAEAQVRLSSFRGFTPHFMLDDVFPESLVRLVAEENPETQSDQFGCLPNAQCFARDGPSAAFENGKNLRNEEIRMGPATRLLYAFGRSPAFISFLQNSFELKGLIPDPFLGGSGLHQIMESGFLALHADFNYNHDMSLHRRVNVFVFLNDDWPDHYGGHLELWNRNLTRCNAKYLPTFGRVVAFRTSDWSYHGHPHPLMAPPERQRRSLAMYYYTANRPESECRGPCNGRHGTSWGVVNCPYCRGRGCADACSDVEAPLLNERMELVARHIRANTARVYR